MKKNQTPGSTFDKKCYSLNVLKIIRVNKIVHKHVQFFNLCISGFKNVPKMLNARNS